MHLDLTASPPPPVAPCPAPSGGRHVPAAVRPTSADDLVTVEGLRVSYRTAAGEVEALHGVDLTIRAGEVVALVGESGSGKSTLAHALIGLLPTNGRVTGGVLRVGAHDVSGWSERRLRHLRGRTIGLVPQDPGVSLNPVARIGPQVVEAIRTHRSLRRAVARTEALQLLRKAGLDQVEKRFRQYPHELSGGMRQRVLIAIAIASSPRLLVADEPTSALDVTVQRRILDHLETLARTEGTAVLLVTHDLGVAADRADRIVVMRGGRVVESGPTTRVLRAPEDGYTRELLDAAPGLSHLWPASSAPPRAAVPRAVVRGRRGEHAPAGGAAAPLVRVTDLVKVFPGHRGTPPVRAVDSVSFDIARGETLALVGESGSGKSTTARLVLGLTRPTSGTVQLDGEDVTSARGSRWRELRRRLQVVYQNPYSSLDPRFSVEEVVTEPLRAFGVGTRSEQRAVAARLLDRVALPASALGRLPGQLSGGQRQRVAIARALALSPDLVVADEAVSALDVSVQAQVLDLLAELQREEHISCLFITHDLGVVRDIAHRVAVMRHGQVLEVGPTARVLTSPTHPYTSELLSAIAGTRHHHTAVHTAPLPSQESA